ncbi:nucleoside kinase [Arthrobacter sp. 135MFCol5.1]|uniref:nucleoside kinase n=1 Tax=Arthrobacter sp. 135MFCol5.1 TaxID=1158050 RepID=UPI000476A97A|nr:nucleoside kinase [Arthrobacter sp. 135MFCol5.1]
MGRGNYLVEGGSGTGKTAVCNELRRRGFQAINGDRELAYQGDPETGEPQAGISGAAAHHHHLWRVGDVEALASDRSEAVTFFCGGSRNLGKFIHLFDGVFVLEVDLETLKRRLDGRPDEEWGGRPAERALIEQLHRTREDIPPGGIAIDATAPLHDVVDEILRQVQATGRA